MSPDSLEAFLDGLSPEARALMEQEFQRTQTPVPAPDDVEAWAADQADLEERCRPVCDEAREQFGASIAERSFGGMPALVIDTDATTTGRPPLIHLHGGGYALFSAHSTLFATIPLAAELRRTIIALDYPLAPGSRFNATVPATTRAVAAVLEEHPGAPLQGDSAGGGLAVAVCNALLQGSGPLPAAVVLLSAWTDLGKRGDTRVTLREHDPLLRYENRLEIFAAAYAGSETDRPEASPVLADYDSRFPPTQLICGSREILVSDTVRLHRKLADGGAHARLEIWDGLHHAFPVVTPLSPEARQARAAISRFLDRFSGDSG